MAQLVFSALARADVECRTFDAAGDAGIIEHAPRRERDPDRRVAAVVEAQLAVGDRVVVGHSGHQHRALARGGGIVAVELFEETREVVVTEEAREGVIGGEHAAIRRQFEHPLARDVKQPLVTRGALLERLLLPGEVRHIRQSVGDHRHRTGWLTQSVAPLERDRAHVTAALHANIAAVPAIARPRNEKRMLLFRQRLSLQAATPGEVAVHPAEEPVAWPADQARRRGVRVHDAAGGIEQQHPDRANLHQASKLLVDRVRRRPFDDEAEAGRRFGQGRDRYTHPFATLYPAYEADRTLALCGGAGSEPQRYILGHETKRVFGEAR